MISLRSSSQPNVYIRYAIIQTNINYLSRYYVHFRANTLGKGMNPLILPAMG